jgi:hypothetical protein
MRKFFSTSFAAAISMLCAPLGLAAPLYTFQTFQVQDAHATSPLDINNAGQIVGNAYGVAINDFSGSPRGFLKEGATITSFMFPGAGPLNGTTAGGINASGAIVGHFAAETQFPLRVHSYVLSGGIFTAFDATGATDTLAKGINSNGDIVGRAYLAADADVIGQGFVRKQGVYSFFDAPGAVAVLGTMPSDINDAGLIVGTFQKSGGGYDSSFLFDGTSFSSIDVPGSIGTTALGINNAGVISGNYSKSVFGIHGFLKIGDIYYSMDVPGITGLLGTQVTGINDLGQVVGNIWPAFDSPQLGFVATPCARETQTCVPLETVPEPSACFSVAAGLLLLTTAGVGRATRACQHRLREWS